MAIADSSVTGSVDVAGLQIHARGVEGGRPGTTRAAIETIALRHQVEVLTQSRRRPQISASDFFAVHTLWFQTLYVFFFVAWYSRT